MVERVHQESDLCFQITRESLERSSMRILSRRYEKSKSTILKIIHRVTEKLPDSLWIAERFKPPWSGILVVDGKVVRVCDQLAMKLDQTKFSDQELKWLHKMRWLCGVDYGTGDLPHYDIAEEESKIELVMFFKKLKKMNYRLTALVSDGNADIVSAARYVYGDQFVHQLRARHFVEGPHRLILKESVSDQQSIELENLVTLIQRTIQANSLEAAANYANQVDQFYTSRRHQLAATIFTIFKTTLPTLITHLKYPNLNIPHTSNEAEILFKQLNLRLKSLDRFFRWQYARDYLKGWALLRRFTVFTDCRNGRKHRNGKSPLELAGCEIKNIDPLKLQS